MNEAQELWHLRMLLIWLYKNRLLLVLHRHRMQEMVHIITGRQSHILEGHVPPKQCALTWGVGTCLMHLNEGTFLILLSYKSHVDQKKRSEKYLINNLAKQQNKKFPLKIVRNQSNKKARNWMRKIVNWMRKWGPIFFPWFAGHHQTFVCHSWYVVLLYEDLMKMVNLRIT